MNEYVRYNEMYDATLRSQLETYFKSSYRTGWHITEIVQLKDGMWILKWKRDLFNHPEASKDEQK